MALWNMPDGCVDASDADYYNRVNPEPMCHGCLLAVAECECCKECGATPDQACEPNCGLGDVEPDDVFAPPLNQYPGPVGVE